MIFERLWRPRDVLAEQKEVNVTPVNKNALKDNPGKYRHIRDIYGMNSPGGSQKSDEARD